MGKPRVPKGWTRNVPTKNGFYWMCTLHGIYDKQPKWGPPYIVEKTDLLFYGRPDESQLYRTGNYVPELISYLQNSGLDPIFCGPIQAPQNNRS